MQPIKSVLPFCSALPIQWHKIGPDAFVPNFLHRIRIFNLNDRFLATPEVLGFVDVLISKLFLANNSRFGL